MRAIDCGSARELMLEAELPELRGNAQTGLARHIATCESCRVHAQRILYGYDQLDAGLATLQAQRKRARWRLFMPIPLAAAAVLAVVLARPSDPEPKEPTALAALMFRRPPVASPPAGKQAIVIDHHDVVVVWLY